MHEQILFQVLDTKQNISDFCLENMLLKLKDKVDDISIYKNAQDLNLWQYAIKNDLTQLIGCLLKIWPNAIYWEDSEKNNIIHHCIMQDKLDALRAILKHAPYDSVLTLNDSRNSEQALPFEILLNNSSNHLILTDLLNYGINIFDLSAIQDVMEIHDIAEAFIGIIKCRGLESDVENIFCDLIQDNEQKCIANFLLTTINDSHISDAEIIKIITDIKYVLPEKLTDILNLLVNGVTSVHLAIIKKRTQLVKVLIKEGAELHNILTSDNSYNVPLSLNAAQLMHYGSDERTTKKTPNITSTTKYSLSAIVESNNHDHSSNSILRKAHQLDVDRVNSPRIDNNFAGNIDTIKQYDAKDSHATKEQDVLQLAKKFVNNIEHCIARPAIFAAISGIPASKHGYRITGINFSGKIDVQSSKFKELVSIISKLVKETLVTINATISEKIEAKLIRAIATALKKEGILYEKSENIIKIDANKFAALSVDKIGTIWNEDEHTTQLFTFRETTNFPEDILQSIVEAVLRNILAQHVKDSLNVDLTFDKSIQKVFKSLLTKRLLSSQFYSLLCVNELNKEQAEEYLVLLIAEITKELSTSKSFVIKKNKLTFSLNTGVKVTNAVDAATTAIQNKIYNQAKISDLEILYEETKRPLIAELNRAMSRLYEQQKPSSPQSASSSFYLSTRELQLHSPECLIIEGVQLNSDNNISEIKKGLENVYDFECLSNFIIRAKDITEGIVKKIERTTKNNSKTKFELPQECREQLRYELFNYLKNNTELRKFLSSKSYHISKYVLFFQLLKYFRNGEKIQYRINNNIISIGKSLPTIDGYRTTQHKYAFVHSSGLIGANIEQWYLDLKNNFEEYLSIALPAQPFENCDLSRLNMAYAYFGNLHLPNNKKLLEKAKLEGILLSLSEARSRSTSISSLNSTDSTCYSSSESNDSISSGSRSSKKTSLVVNSAAFFRDPTRSDTPFFGEFCQENVSHEIEIQKNLISYG